MRTVKIQAFAKINIGLTVFERRPTGYHDIEGIFQSVDIADEIDVSMRGEAGGSGDSGSGIEVQGELGCPPEQSSIYRAIVEFGAARGLNVAEAGISVVATKGIPSGAGLGGAGADAAATLVALDALFGAGLTGPELARIAERVASDVPFFMYGGAAVVRGRGERVEPILARTDYGLVVVRPAWESKTPQSYAELDNLRERGVLSPAPRARNSDAQYALARTTDEYVAQYGLPVGRWTFSNDFEAVLRRRHLEYGALFDALRESGASFVSLSGSGSCLFGVFETKRAAERAAAELRAKTKKGAERGLLPIAGIFAATPLARSMNVSYIQCCSEDTRSDKERPSYGSD